jgi:hypothetical protein
MIKSFHDIVQYYHDNTKSERCQQYLFFAKANAVTLFFNRQALVFFLSLCYNKSKKCPLAKRRKDENMMRSDFEAFISLDGDWELFYEENRNLPSGSAYGTLGALKLSTFARVPARVPGNFELDLMRAGVIEDVFYGENPLLAQKRENLHLWYVRTLSLTLRKSKSWFSRAWIPLRISISTAR